MSADGEIPSGYYRLEETDRINPGDILMDVAGRVRGPIDSRWDGVGQFVGSYTTPDAAFGLAAAQWFARKAVHYEVRFDPGADACPHETQMGVAILGARNRQWTCLECRKLL